MPWKYTYKPTDEEKQKLLIDFQLRHKLSNKKLGRLFGVRPTTIRGMLYEAGRKPSDLMIAIVMHLDGGETVEERLERIRREPG